MLLACMDTSDGLIATLDQFMRLNNVGFELKEDLEKVIDENALKYVRKLEHPRLVIICRSAR